MNKDIEPFVAHVWEDIRQQHLLGMLEDLESLKYVPVKIRRKAASEPLSLFDTNSKVSEDQKNSYKAKGSVCYTIWIMRTK
jgi:hypothetical protein